MGKQGEANQDIRKEIVKRGLWMWQIAARIGIEDSTLSRWLRIELAPDDPRRQRILEVLNEADESEGVTR